MQRLIESNDLTLYGLSNAVTRHSQDVESYDRASELESIGYSILTMPPRQWSRINRQPPNTAHTQEDFYVYDER